MTPPSAGELVARVHVTLRQRGGEVIMAVLRGNTAWVLVVTPAKNPVVAHLTSRPAGKGFEPVMTCEPFADAIECPASVATAAWGIERTEAGPSKAVRLWRRQAASKDPRPLAMTWGTR